MEYQAILTVIGKIVQKYYENKFQPSICLLDYDRARNLALYFMTDFDVSEQTTSLINA